MTPEQEYLANKARSSLEAARLLLREGFPEYAASRAYYAMFYLAMFYLAEALLLGRGLSFSKHSGVQSAFGREFVKTGQLPRELHQYLIRGMDLRQASDYGLDQISAGQAALQIDRAEEFLRVAGALLGHS